MTISPEDIAAARLQMIANARTFADLLESIAPEILPDGERQQAYNDGFDSGFGTANDGYGPPEELTDAIAEARAEGEKAGRFIKLSDREQLRAEGAAGERQRIRQAITDCAMKMGYEADEVWGVAFPHLADFVHDLLDGVGDE